MERIIFTAIKTIQGKTELIKSFFKLPDTNYAQDVLIVYFIIVDIHLSKVFIPLVIILMPNFLM